MEQQGSALSGQGMTEVELHTDAPELWEFDVLTDSDDAASSVSGTSSSNYTGEGSRLEDAPDLLELDFLTDSTEGGERAEAYLDSDSDSAAEACAQSDQNKVTALLDHSLLSTDQTFQEKQLHNAVYTARSQMQSEDEAAPMQWSEDELPCWDEQVTAVQGMNLEQQAEGRPEPLRTPDSNHMAYADDAPIWQRTRARNPMKGVTIEELDALLQDDFLDSDYEDDEAYREFLEAIQGDGNSLDINLLPEEEDDDDDYMLDLDELIAACEEKPGPPLQTRFGKGGHGSASDAPLGQWVPQELPGSSSDAPQSMLHEAPLEGGVLKPTEQSYGAQGDGHPLPGPVSNDLQNLATAQAEAMRESQALLKNYNKWKMQEKKRAQIKLKARKAREAASSAEGHQLQHPYERGLQNNQSGDNLPEAIADFNADNGSGCNDHLMEGVSCNATDVPESNPVLEVGQHVDGIEQAADPNQGVPSVLRKEEGRDAARMQQASAQERGVDQALEGSQVAQANCRVEVTAEPPLSEQFEKQKAKNTHPVEARRGPDPHSQSHSRVAAEGAAPVQPQALRLSRNRILVPAAALPFPIQGPLYTAYHGPGDHPRVVAHWQRQQLGQFRRQVGHHFQLLCHVVALLKCNCYSNDLLQQCRAILSHMVAYCVHAMGMKELRGGPFLTPDITFALDQSCPSAPAQAPVRCLLAVPILPHIGQLLAATEVTDKPAVGQPTSQPDALGQNGKPVRNRGPPDTSPLPELPEAVQRALENLAPYMTQHLFPVFQEVKLGWTRSEVQLLKHALKRFGSDLDSVQKFLLPTKPMGSIQAYIQVLKDKEHPQQRYVPPLTRTEIAIIESAMRRCRDPSQVWTLLAMERTRLHRGVEELKRLYQEEGHWAALMQRSQATIAKPAGSLRQTQSRATNTQLSHHHQPFKETQPTLQYGEETQRYGNDARQAIPPPASVNAHPVTRVIPIRPAPFASSKDRAAALRARLNASLEGGSGD